MTDKYALAYQSVDELQVFTGAPAAGDVTPIFDTSAGLWKKRDATTSELGDATAAEVDRVADVSTRLVTLTGDTALTLAAHEGRVVLLGEVGGDALLTVTLPAATGSGARYEFLVSVVNTSSYVIKVADASDVMAGSIVSLADSGDTVVGFEALAASDTITLNGTTTGGASIGDTFTLVDIAADQWAVKGSTTSTGAEATPFSATV